MSITTAVPDKNIYLPIKATIRSVESLAADVRFFRLEMPEEFAYQPGQFVMVSVWGAGEIPISITSTHGTSPFLELCIRSVGTVTRAVNALGEGASLWIRGPYGNSFPVFPDTRDSLFVCGGIGIIPLRPLVNRLLTDPAKRDHVSIIYGSRSPSEVLLASDTGSWTEHGATVVMTVDTCEIDDWKGCKGLVTDHFGKAKVDFRNCTAYICGPHPMIQATMRDLSLMGMREDRIITTLEAHMKCGVGKCGHCFCGGKLICEDGPVFSLAEIKKLAIRPGVDTIP